MSYKIAGIEFKNKAEIKDTVKAIIKVSAQRELTKTEKVFILSLLKYHPSPSVRKCEDFMIGNGSFATKNRVIIAITHNGAGLDVSFNNIINNLHPSGGLKIENKADVLPLIFTFKFGKYKGQTIEWVYKNDKKYIDWLMDNFDDDGIKQAIERYVLTQASPQEALDKAIEQENYELAAIIRDNFLK